MNKSKVSTGLGNSCQRLLAHSIDAFIPKVFMAQLLVWEATSSPFSLNLGTDVEDRVTFANLEAMKLFDRLVPSWQRFSSSSCIFRVL